LKIFLVSFLLSLSAHAELVSFSNPHPEMKEGLYVCNAGISHARAAAPNSSCDSDCTPGVINDPSKGIDALYVQVPNASGSTTGTTFPSLPNGQVTELSLPGMGWINQIVDLNFKLSSETYGAHYFVEFCYQGPVSYTVGNSKDDASKGLYYVQASVSNNGSTYLTDSGMAMQLSWACDLRNQGQQKAARTIQTIAPQSSLEADRSSVTPIQAGASVFAPMNLQQRINDTTDTVPRFCVLRVDFAETATGPRLNTNADTSFTVDLNVLKQGLDVLSGF
jgi:hypothetical protein